MTPNVGIVLAVLAGVAFLCPIIGEWLRVPNAVVELIAGLGLGLVVPASTIERNAFVSSLGALGFIILMFLVGTEFDISELWHRSRGALAAGFGLFVVSYAFSELLLGRGAGASSLWVLSGAATSVGLAAPMLYAHGGLHSRFARDVLVVGSAAEVAYLVVLNALSVSQHHGPHATTLIVALRTSGVLVLAVATSVVIRRARSRLPRHFHRWFRRDDPIELGLRGTFALLFIFVAMSTALRIPDVIGALVAGIIFRTVIGNAKVILERMTSFANSFFIPFFFLSVGMKTNISPSVGHLLPLIALALAALAIPKVLVGAFARWRGASWRESAAASVMLMAPLTLLISTAEIGTSRGIVSQQTAAAIVLTATISSLIFPVIAKFLLPPRESISS